MDNIEKNIFTAYNCGCIGIDKNGYSFILLPCYSDDVSCTKNEESQIPINDKFDINLVKDRILRINTALSVLDQLEKIHEILSHDWNKDKRT